MAARSAAEKLSLYRKSLVFSWGFVDYNDWPVKLNSIFHLFLEEFGGEFLDDLTYLEEVLTLPLPDIARLFSNPARIYRLIDSIIYSMRRRKYPLQRQREIVLKMLSMVKSLKYGSEFNEEGRNIIYDPETVDHVVRHMLPTNGCSLEESRLLHRLCGMLWAYTETIFFRAHDVTKEIHGPYIYDQDYPNIVVKEYFNLQPSEIWNKAALLPWTTIKVYKCYNDQVRITIDALNHLYHEGGSLIPNLKGYALEVDGKQVTLEKAKEIGETIARLIPRMTSTIDRLSFHEKVVKYAEIFWFRKRPLRDRRGLGWRCPEEVRKKIYDGAVEPRRAQALSEEQVRRLAFLTI